MKRRIFIAINLPENIKKKLTEYKDKWDQLDPNLIRWVAKENLHITLVFVGYVTDDEMYEVCQIVKDVAKEHNPFIINLERIILGPPNKPPRMFWVEGEKSKEIAELQGNLRERIEQRGGARYEAYRPHINLARFKQRLVTIQVNEPFKTQISVETIEIMQSNLKRSGAEYSVLESVQLGE